MSHIVFFKRHPISAIDQVPNTASMSGYPQTKTPPLKILYQVDCKETTETARSRIPSKHVVDLQESHSSSDPTSAKEEAAQPRGTTSNTKTSFLTNTRNKELSTS